MPRKGKEVRREQDGVKAEADALLGALALGLQPLHLEPIDDEVSVGDALHVITVHEGDGEGHRPGARPGPSPRRPANRRCRPSRREWRGRRRPVGAPCAPARSPPAARRRGRGRRKCRPRAARQPRRARRSSRGSTPRLWPRRRVPHILGFEGEARGLLKRQVEHGVDDALCRLVELLEEERGDGEDVADVFEAVAVVVIGEVARRTKVETRQIADGVVVLGAVEAPQGDAARLAAPIVDGLGGKPR